MKWTGTPAASPALPSVMREHICQVGICPA